MARTRYVTLTIERVKKADADKIVRAIVTEFGAISVLVEELRTPQKAEKA